MMKCVSFYLIRCWRAILFMYMMPLYAMELRELTSLQTQALAIVAMGEMLLNGELGLPDYTSAHRFFEQAAAQEHSGIAQIRALAGLGQQHHWGRGVEKNCDKAYAYFERVLNQDYLNESIAESCAKAALHIAVMHYFEELPKNLAALRDYLSVALELSRRKAELCDVETVASLLLDNEYQVDKVLQEKASLLHIAVQRGEVERLKVLLKSNYLSNRPKWTAINTGDNLGTTALHLACKLGALSAAEILVEQGADCSVQDHGGFSPLHYAVLNNQYDLIVLLLKNGVRCDQRNGGGYTALHYATLKRQKTIVKQLLAYGADPLIETEYLHQTAFGCALENGFDELVDLMLSFLSEKQELTADGALQRTVIQQFKNHPVGVEQYKKLLNGLLVGLCVPRGSHNSAEGAMSAVEQKYILTQEKTDNAEGAAGEYMAAFDELLKAADKGGIETVRRLLGIAPACINARDENGRSVLHRAAQSGRVAVVEFLCKHPQKMSLINAADATAMTPLSCAVDWEKPEGRKADFKRVVELLIQHGATQEIVDKRKRTVLHYAARACTGEIVHALVSGIPQNVPAYVNRADAGGKTALHEAYAFGNSEAVRALILVGAREDLRDKSGKVPKEYSGKLFKKW